MKRYILLFLIIGLFLLSGCNNNGSSQIEKTTVKEKQEEIKQLYKDDNPIRVGLYENKGNKYTLYKDNSLNIRPRTDIETFQVVFSTEEEVLYSGNKQDFIKSLWDSIDIQFTLGIMLEYDTVNEGHIKHVIYNPNNTLEHDHYIQVYLYDAIAHKNDKWYSHITKDEYNDDTYITSFKLYGHDKIDEVIFPIKVSVFTYDSEDDFDEYGNYRGNSIYTIELSKK